MKRCSTCREEFPRTVEHFAPAKRNSDGLSGKCRECQRAYQRERYDKKKEHLRKYQQDWREKNRAKVNAQARNYQRSWREKNPEAARIKSNTASKLFKERNPERAQEFSRESYARCGKYVHLKYNYGITREAYEELLKNQNGVCAICFTAGGGNGLGVDHCHRTGLVRGLLCHCCNTAIGLLKENPNIMLKAVSYVTRSSKEASRAV